MSRLQKKCLIATAGTHLLLVVILLVGPAFFYSHPKPDNSQVLDVIPANAIDAILNSGVKSAQAPAPTPIVPPPPPVPLPVQPQQQPTPTPPPPAPTQSFVDKVRDFFKPVPEKLSPDDLKPADEPSKPKKSHEVKVNMDPVKRTPRDVAQQQQSQNDAREQRQREKQYQNLVRNLQNSFTPATVVEMPGASSVSYASYDSVLRSIYDHAWKDPDNATDDQANTRVSITVASDGTVVSAHIIDPSGDASVDASVQHALDNVTFIAPFPDGATESKKTFIITFNLKAKRMLE